MPQDSSFLFVCFFRAEPMAYGSSQARGRIQAAAGGLHHSHSDARSKPTSVTYTTAHGNTGSLTHWARPGIKPESSRILVRFISTAPQWELPGWSSLFLFQYRCRVFCLCCTRFADFLQKYFQIVTNFPLAMEQTLLNPHLRLMAVHLLSLKPC